MSVQKTNLFQPRRLASWWSVLDDLQWPQAHTRDKIKRRADQLAEAGVDTAVQFGFHFRFDAYPYFGLLHGYLADVAENLHQRGIRFMEHYSCNLIARPRDAEELLFYHSRQRHHVAIHPDAQSAEIASYAGYRFNDLRSIDVVTGQPVYVPAYNCELFCLNNPGFRAMHAEYLRRLLAEVPCDGIMVDDMCDYAYFRSCGCEHCRRIFREEYGRELPPVTDASFWGQVTAEKNFDPSTTAGRAWNWGNYENPAFLDWVQLKHRYGGDHLKLVKEVMGPDKMLFTCCCVSGPMICNSMGLSHENFAGAVDWMLLENCGLTAATARWERTEPEAMLTRAVADRKAPGTPPVALSYSIYEDGAYLSWAIARFWNVSNWYSTHTGLPVMPPDAKDDGELIGPYNRWEEKHSKFDLYEGSDVPEVRLAFNRLVRDRGWRDSAGRDHWERVAAWSRALLKHNIGYRFVTTSELGDAAALAADKTPLILDGCAFMEPAQADAVKKCLASGGPAWIVPPLAGVPAQQSATVTMIPEDLGAAMLPDILGSGKFTPRIRYVSGPEQWRVRLRTHGNRLVIHLLNGELKPIEHPTVTDRWLQSKVLYRLEAAPSDTPLVVELDAKGLPAPVGMLRSPELNEHRAVRIENLGQSRYRLTINLRDLRIYGCIHE